MMTQHVLSFLFNNIIQLVLPQEKRRYALLSVLPPAALQAILFYHPVVFCLACLKAPDGDGLLVSGSPATNSKSSRVL